VHAGDLAEGFEEGPEIAFRGLEIHVTDKKTFHVASPGILLRRIREHPAKVARAWTGGFESAEVNEREDRQAATTGNQAIQRRKSDNNTIRHKWSGQRE
jgi:hypothetical protein